MAKVTPPTRNDIAFGRRLRDARERAGLSIDRAAGMAAHHLASNRGPSRQLLVRYEKGEVVEDHADIFVVLALAETYDIPVVELSAEIAERIEKVREGLFQSQHERLTLKDLTDSPES